MSRAVVAVAVLAVLAGCAGGGVDADRINENASYEWDTDTTAKINVTGSQYKAVYSVDANESLEIYRLDDLGSERPVPFRALKYRAPNGTVVRGANLSVTEEDPRAVVTPPDAGQVAYTAPTPPKRFATPTLVTGSYVVVLPANMGIAVPVLGTISPGGVDRTVEDGRTRLRWDELERGERIELGYYLDRDLQIFVGLIGLLALLTVGGVVYFRFQLRSLARRREATEDD